MPLLPFEHPQTGEVREVFVDIKCQDSSQFAYQTIDGLKWKRILEVPNMATDTKIDPFKAGDYVRNTGAKKGTYGDLVDYSQELSAKRAAAAGGKDPVEAKYYEEWSAKRGGQTHHKKKLDDANAILKPLGVQIKP